jgi:hypothetical protein
MLLSLAVIGGFALYVMNAEERERLRVPLRRCHVAALRHAATIADAGARVVRAARAGQRWARACCGVLIALAAVTLLGSAFIDPPFDITADLDRLVSTESRTAAAYDAAAAQFRLGTTTAVSLAQVIDRRIKPELQVMRMRLASLDHIRPEQQPALEKAREYVRLREESWRQRAEALHRRDLAALRRVETTERAALATLESLIPHP